MHETKNCPTCENYIANYKIFQEHPLNSGKFPGFPGVVENLTKTHTHAHTHTH